MTMRTFIALALITRCAYAGDCSSWDPSTLQTFCNQCSTGHVQGVCMNYDPYYCCGDDSGQEPCSGCTGDTDTCDWDKMCAPKLCTGLSVNLPADQCAAWTKLYDSTAGPGWRLCASSRTDPCSCLGYDGATPVCNADHTTVRQVNLFGARLNGTLPDEIGAWKDIELFDVSGNLEAPNSIFGTLPASMANWKALGHFAVYENHLSGGLLPPLPFDLLTVCTLSLRPQGANVFQCPWPAGTTAVCQKYAGSSWVPVTDSDCMPWNYKCVNNTCVQAVTGVPQATCEAACGPATLLE